MKKKIRFLPLLFALMGLFFALCALRAVQKSLYQPPYILETPRNAASHAEALMDSICRGDYETASSLLLGNPDLEMDAMPADSVGILLWNAYIASASYTLVEEPYATETGLAQTVRFDALDLAAILEAAGPLAQELFQTRRDNAEDLSAIYDSDGNYRDDFVQQVLLDATEQALRENSETIPTYLTLQLTFRDGNWLITPDQALLQVICGGVKG